MIPCRPCRSCSVLACRYGPNVRLSELQSAIGRIQLQRLPEWTSARTRTALLSGCLSLVSWGRPA